MNKRKIIRKEITGDYLHSLNKIENKGSSYSGANLYRDESQVYKIFPRWNIIAGKGRNLERLAKLQVILYSSYVEELLVMNGFLIGCSNPFITGDTLTKWTNKDIDYDLLQKCADTTANTLEQYHKKNCCINDIHLDNLMIGTSTNQTDTNGYIIDLDSARFILKRPPSSAYSIRRTECGYSLNVDKKVDHLKAFVAYLSCFYKKNLEKTVRDHGINELHFELQKLDAPRDISKYIDETYYEKKKITPFNEPLKILSKRK